ncbi:MAG: ATP-binding protein [Spirochaetales bacterium]
MSREEIIRQLNNELALKRKRAELFAAQNKEKAFEIDEYAKLDKKERELVLDISKANFKKENATALEKELAKVQAQKNKVLIENNIDPTTLIPSYECKNCNDTGIVNDEYCNCFKQALNNKLMQESQIDLDLVPLLKDYNLAVFEKESIETFSKVVDFCQKFVNSFPNSKVKNVIFSGETGTGKTYLTKTLAKEAISKGYNAYYVTAFNLNNTLLKYHTTFSDDKLYILEPILNSDLLIIDDLGIEPVLKNVTIEYLLLVINERLQNNKSTIINTNLNPDHILDRYGERIFSRLMNKQNSMLINIAGKDLRLKKH